MYEYKTEIGSIKLSSYIKSKHPEITEGKMYTYLRENKIKVNGKKLPLSARLEKGDIVRLYLPLNYSAPSREPDVVYEDSNVLIINKPAGIAVVDKENKSADTLYTRALAKYAPNNLSAHSSALTSGAPRPCHRLDTGTSGLVIFAKNDESENILTALIKDKKIGKRYLAATYGIPKPDSGRLTHFIVKDAEAAVVKAYTRPMKDAKQAVLDYKTIAVYGNIALLDISLITGRTHQIRVQMSAVNCPVLGDGKYGTNSINRRYKMKYQALCAYMLNFPSDMPKPLSALSSKTFTAKKPWWYDIDKI